MRTNGAILWKILAAGGLILLFSASAGANFSAVGGSGETNHIDILDTLYGGDFSAGGTALAFGDLVYGNGLGITARRVDDFGLPGGTLNVLAGFGNTAGPGTSSGIDQVWDDGITAISGEAKFAAYSQAFGYTDAGGYHELFEVASGGSGFFAPGSHVFDDIDLTGSTWTWDRSNANGNGLPGQLHWSSNQSLNADKLDHLLTYEIIGLDDPGESWLLFWDDQFRGGDRDFNDLVIAVNAIAAIPLPGAMLLSAVGLGMVGFLRRRLA